MKRVNGMLLHELGRNINRIDSITENSTYREIRRDCLDCMMAVKHFVFKGEFAGMFDLCRKPAQELIDILKRISDTSEKNRDKVISPPMYGDLRNKLQNFNLLLDSEIQSGSLFLTMQKGGYDTRKLLKEGEALFPRGLEQYCKQAIPDVREGMRCLLFEVYTAAAFHFHRANESVVRNYAATKGIHPKKKHRNLGNYTQELVKAGAPHQITQQLKRIADDLRNPLVHEDHIIEDFEDVDDIYKEVRSVMYKMIGDMTGTYNPPS